ncbi:hypothetical protein JTE90_002794 [Oedothorax gibbosus]|uniref:Titin n=1 Tax=Oedothorax gibbosus TaxID=931172 RepID=A0AAV6UHS1_9ARAC|nr:hypothetical protein JTE90_002794 [Oedothorax gibbosus]
MLLDLTSLLAGVICEPSRPEGPLIISDIGVDSVHLSWKPPAEDNGGSILGYIVEAKDILHVDVRKIQMWSEGTRTEYTVRNLETSHIYQFRVYAQNEAGRSEGLLNKTLLRIKAKSRKPPRPSKPTAELQGADSILLTWTVLEDQNEKDLTFLVERFEPKSNLWFQCNRESVTKTKFLVTGLGMDRDYRFRVSSENKYGVSRPSEESEVISMSQIQGIPPSVLIPLRDCYVKPNDSAIFRCEYAGTLPIDVQWTKDGLRVSENCGAMIKLDNGNSSELRLTEVDSDDDECSIQCSLKNNFGSTCSEAKIKTLSSPQIRCPSSYKDGLTFDFGDILRLRVSASGSPTPKIHWFFNGHNPPEDHRTQTLYETNTVEIRIADLGNEHSGDYNIVAQNEVGEDSVTVKVTISGPPDPPEGPLWFDLSDENDEVFLKWNLPLCDGGSEIFSYQVEKKLMECNEWLRQGSTHKTSFYLGLQHAIDECCFRVRAVNIYGTSESSMEQIFQKESKSQLLNNFQDPSSVAKTNIENPETNPTSWCGDDNSAPQTFELENKKSNEVKHHLEESSFLHTDTSVSKGLTSYSSYGQTTKFENDVVEIFKDSPSKMFQELIYPVCKIEEIKCYTASTLTLNVNFEYCDSTLNFIRPLEISCIISFGTENHYLEVFSLINYIQTYPLELAFKPRLEMGEIIINLKKPIIVTLHPFILEDTLFSTFLPLSDCCHTVISYYEAITVFTKILIETVGDYVHEETEYKKTSYSIHKHTASEELVDVLPLPVTTYKPAMSVLPMRRQIQSVTDSTYTGPKLVCGTVLPPYKETPRYTVIFQESYAFNSDLANAYDSCDNIAHDKNGTKTIQDHYSSKKTRPSQISWKCPSWLPNVSSCTLKNKIEDDDFGKSQEMNVLDQFQFAKETTRLNYDDEDTYENNFVQESGKDFIDIKKEDIEIFDHDEKDNFKDHTTLELPQLSDKTSELLTTQEDIFKYDSEEESDLQEFLQLLKETSYLDVPECISDEQENAFRGILQVTPETLEESEEIVCKYNLKEKSAQELLELAEEVERNFNEKAEQIESLESVLQEELASLEKDLSTVNEIHRNLQTSVDSIDSNMCDYINDGSSNLENEVDKDLIDLNNDTILTPQHKVNPDQYAPVVLVHLQNRIVQSGTRTRLYCSISGEPIPDIVWMKNGKPLPNSSRYVCSNLEEYGLFIDIYNAKSTDSGEYTCIATNQHGSEHSSAYLQVVGQRENSPEEPNFVKSPDDLSVAAKDTFVLEWKVTGMPFPAVTWFKNAEKLSSSLRIDTFVSHRGVCRLVVHDAVVYDSAIYSCYLENECGSAISTILVTVADETKQNYDILYKDKWDPLSTHSKIETKCSETQSLYRRSPLESTKYLHRKHLHPKKSMKFLPGPPLDVRALGSGQTWVLLSWSPPHQQESSRMTGLEYRIDRKSVYGLSWKEVGKTLGTVYTVHGCKPGRSYTFRVSCGNSSGWGQVAFLPHPVHFSPKKERSKIHF